MYIPKETIDLIKKEIKKAKLGPWHKFKFGDGQGLSIEDYKRDIKKLTEEIIQKIKEHNELIYPKRNPR